MKVTSQSRRQLILAGIGASLASPATWAQGAYPNKPITFIVPFPAGGITDNLLRTLTSVASRSLGQPFVIENKPGAYTTIAAGALSRAKPDGYTLGVLASILNRFKLLGTTSLDAARDFTPVANVAGQTFGIVVRADSPLKSLADLVKAAKAKPGELSYGTSGIASATHVGIEEFSAMAGIQLNHIPYKGLAESLPQMLGGQVDMIVEAAGWAPTVEAGKARVLCIWNEQRHPRLPNVPTLKELGYNLVMTVPFGIGAPPGLDPEAAAKLAVAFKQAILSPEFKAEADKVLAPVIYQDADTFAKAIRADFDYEKSMIERLKLKEKFKG